MQLESTVEPAATGTGRLEQVGRETAPAVVRANGVFRRYGDGDTAVDALRGISLEIPDQRLTAIMGPSGSGKSTLMHILAGLDRPSSGTVTISGSEITSLDDTSLTKLRRRHVGFIFQFFNLLPMLTARENIVLPLEIAGKNVNEAWLGEPTGNLDSKTGGEILELLRSSVDSYGQTIVMVTHDPRVATVADRVLFLADGLIVKELANTTPEEVHRAIGEIGR